MRVAATAFNCMPSTTQAWPSADDRCKTERTQYGRLKTWNGTIDARCGSVIFTTGHLAGIAVPTQQARRPNISSRWRAASWQGGRSLGLRAIETTLGDGLPALRLDEVRGQAVWQRVLTQRVMLKPARGATGCSPGAPFMWG